jgi:hypothetical protein
MKLREMPTDVRMLNEQLSDCLEEWEKIVPRPLHQEMVEQWKNEMKNYLAKVSSDDDCEMADSIGTGLLEAYESWASVISNVTTFSGPVDHEKTFALMQRPQTAQRTTDWYTEFKTRLTASEIFKLFGPPRERAILVMQKSGKQEMPPRSNNLVTLKEKMGPLDWGICFEPVVKQILEHEWGAMIHECGRFVHPTDPHLAASPDGLLLRVNTKPEAAGHLLEIKCPKTRKIGLKLPTEYYYQMQLQMEVTGVRACEYVEASFEMKEADTESQWCGNIAVVGCFCETDNSWKPCRYIYGPINNTDWKAADELGLNERILELNPWSCQKFHHETVVRDEAWFTSIKPKLDEFWKDVERAANGDFVVPESSRKKKATVCEIVDSEPEQNNQ